MNLLSPGGRAGTGSPVVSIWILGDQLWMDQAALAGADPSRSVVLMVESRGRGSQRRYHQQKLVLVYSAMRHFAAALQARGWRVDYHRGEDTPVFVDALRRHVRQFQPKAIRVMQPSDWATTEALPVWSRQAGVRIETVPSNQFLVPREEFREWAGSSRHLLMENHYRRVRRQLGILVDAAGQPEGGRWNLDAENRRTVTQWKKDGSPRPAAPLREPPDAITREVIGWVEREFAGHPGRADGFWLPVDAAGARRWLAAFVEERLGRFGPYEDLMLAREPTLFHSVLSPLLNLGLLTPMECVEAAVAAWRAGRAPLESVEGFVRQVIGWREFIHGVYWLRMPGYTALNALEARRPLPAWFWTGETDLQCLRQCLRQVIDTGYNHHIQRLMVLGNFLLLAGVDPGEALGWFNEMYVDAHDWVMAANVIGMVLHADGGFMASKPYAASGAYLSRMSDYCQGCRYRPTEKSGPDACPFNPLYWDFIGRHARRFASNPRMAVMVRSWEGKSAAEKASIRAAAAKFLDGMG